MKTKTLFTAALAAMVMAMTFMSTVLAADKPATTIWQSHGEGRSAEVQFSTDGGGGRINLVQMNGSTNTLMFYEIWGHDPASEICEYIIDIFGNEIENCVFTRFQTYSGWGLIPNSDLQFTATNAQLVTTTGANFTTTRCTTDTSGATPVTTCTNGIPVSFDIEWVPNNLSTQTIKGDSEQAFAAFVFQSKGEHVARSAYVFGYVLGRALTNAPGRLGTTKGKHTATVTAP